MGVDYKGDGAVELTTAMSKELYALLVKHAQNARLDIDGAVQQILSVALEYDTTTFERLAEADRLREEAEAKVAEYERRIVWYTTCGSCATLLDSSIKETERAVKAGAKLAEAEELLEKYRKRMAGGDERTHQIGMRHLAATEGPWWSDENEWCYRLHGVMARIPASEHIGEQIMNKQILKAEKQGQSYQEYWPDASDAAFIENAWADIAFLLTELQHTKNKVDFLLKMPKRIWSSIGLACTAPENSIDFCECEQAAKVALDVGQIMRDELHAMDEIVPVEPTPEPS